MGLPGDVQEESLSDTAPLSPEELARCTAKNSQLNASLGLENDDSLDPAMFEEDEETVSDSNHGFLMWSLSRLLKEMHCWILLWNILNL